MEEVTGRCERFQQPIFCPAEHFRGFTFSDPVVELTRWGRSMLALFHTLQDLQA
jgi:hypothetical protein